MGAAVSIRQVYIAVPVLPATSVARTANVCGPSARPAYEAVVAVVHGRDAAVSSWQVGCAVPGCASETVKVKAALRLLDSAAGC